MSSSDLHLHLKYIQYLSLNSSWIWRWFALVRAGERFRFPPWYSYKITITETAIFIYLLRCATHSTGCIRSSCPCSSPPPTTCCLANSGSHRQQSKTLRGWLHLDWSVTQTIYRNTQKIDFLKSYSKKIFHCLFVLRVQKNDIRDGERWPNSQTIQDKQHHINGVSVGQNHSQYEIFV